MTHAVSRLRSACLTHSSTLPRLDRGGPRKARCEACRLPPSHCLCAWRPELRSRAAVCLVMAEFEALKPSNTGWLVADVLPETKAFSWSRLAIDPALPALLADPQWQPYVVFPGEFAEPQRVRTELLPAPAAPPPPPPAPAAPMAGTSPDEPPAASSTARPLFVLLDGTWSEARKIFRKSPWMDHLPVLSLQPEQLSRYRLRRSLHAHHFCTSEVAALCLAMAGDTAVAEVLEAYLAVFSNRYLRARQSLPADPQDADHQRLQVLMQALDPLRPWPGPTPAGPKTTAP